MYIERRTWQWVDWALFGIITSWLSMGLLFLTTEAGLGDWGDRFIYMGWVLVSYFSILLVWHPGYTNRLALPFVVLATGGSLEIYLTYKIGEGFAGVVVVMLLLLAFHSRGAKLTILNVAVFLLALPLVEYPLLIPEERNFPHLFNHMMDLVVLYAIGYGVQRLWSSSNGVKKLYEENLRQYKLIQEQNRALEQYANHVEKLTLLEERNRMARELHDTVGHTFTSVIMGMDAVSYLLEAAPEKAKEKLEVLRQVTRSGLEEVRRSIHQIAPQDEEGTFEQMMSRLAHEFAVHTGTQVSIDWNGQACELPKPIQLTLVRCLQEALTNAKRHGHAQRIDIRLDYLDDRICLKVSDDGIGVKDLSAGFGLCAMKERLESLQGQLELVSTVGQGTVLTCVMPLRR